MKLAMIAPLVAPLREPQMGGAQALVADLAAGLTARGHEVQVYAAAGSVIPGVCVHDTGIRAASLESTRFIHNQTGGWAGGQIENNAGSDGDYRSEAAFAGIYADIRRRGFELVHNHAFDAPAIRLAATVEIPVVHTLHMPPAPAMAEALCEAAQRPSQTVVACVSQAQAASWRRHTRIDAVLANGVPCEHIPWRETPGEGVVFAGRFSPEKGTAEAITIARAAGMPITLYGDAYEVEYARQQVYSRQGEPGIAIFSAQPRARLWQIMMRAAAVLCPADWDEPFGLAAAEAQACGTPVVGFRRGGLSEVVAEGVSGWLVAPGDLTAAAAALREVVQLDRAACRRHAVEHLDLSACLDAHQQLYQAIACGKNQPRGKTSAAVAYR